MVKQVIKVTVMSLKEFTVNPLKLVQIQGNSAS